MRCFFILGLLAALFALASCTESKPSTADPVEAAPPQQPNLAKPILASQLAGKRLCRNPSGPEDTGNFDIQLLPNGQIKGKGDFSGAAGVLKLQSGTWAIQDTDLLVALRFAGHMAGQQQEMLVPFEVSAKALLDAQADCLAVHPAF